MIHDATDQEILAAMRESFRDSPGVLDEATALAGLARLRRQDPALYDAWLERSRRLRRERANLDGQVRVISTALATTEVSSEQRDRLLDIVGRYGQKERA